MSNEDANQYQVPPFHKMLGEDDTPYAVVERSSWCTWRISIYHGVFRWGPDGLWFTHLGTEKSAERKAERLIDKYEHQRERREERKAESFEVY